MKGVSGLFTKPASSILDGASKTLEGVKVSMLKKKNFNYNKRNRYPRVFYSKEHYFKKYSNNDAYILKLLKKIQDGKYKDKTFFGNLT